MTPSRITLFTLVLAVALAATSLAATQRSRLASPDPKVRREALGELDTDTPAGRAARAVVLRMALEDPSRDVVLAATQVFARYPDAESSVPTLARALQSEDEGRRFGAAVILRQLGPRNREAIPDLVRTVRDPSSQVRFVALEALSTAKSWTPDGIRAAVEALGDEDEAVQIQATVVLSMGGGATRAAVVAALRRSAHPRVRRNAVITLNSPDSLDDPEALAALQDATRDPDPQVATLAKGVVPYLEVLRKARDEERSNARRKPR